VISSSLAVLRGAMIWGFRIIESPIFIDNDLLHGYYYYINRKESSGFCIDDKSMKYAIITNPSSGEMSAKKKREEIEKASRILHAPVYGFETNSREEFVDLAKKISADCDVLVVGGGDGTFSDVINAIDLPSNKIAFLPLGSGNALRNALGLEGTISEISRTILAGRVHNYDLIECSSRRLAFMVSVGIEGVVVRLREKYLDVGIKGLQSYLIPTLDAYMRNYKRVSASVAIDGVKFGVEDLMSIMVVKQPFFGYKMKVVPNARFDDGKLHVMVINSSFAELLFGAVSSFTIGNLIGDYYTGEDVFVETDEELYIQIDGNVGWKAESFEFKIRKGILKVVH